MKRVALITAMKVENDAIRRVLSERVRRVTISRKFGTSYDIYRGGGRVLYLAESGIGPVNAALTLAGIAELENLDAVLLLGVAGALVTGLKIGDWVIPERILQHDSYCSAEPGSSDAGFMAPGRLYGSLDPESREDAYFYADPKLTRWLARVSRHKPRGVLLSGSEFVGSARSKRALAKRVRGAIAVEMEAAGIAQVARKLGLPFAVAKTVADRLSPRGEILSDYKSFLRLAADHSARVAAALVEG